MVRSRPRCVAAGATALLLAGLVAAQTGRAKQAPPAAPADFVTEPSPAPAAGDPPQRPAARPREKGIDELVVTLEQIKARKAELDRAEKETVALLMEKVRQQRQRLQKLGVADEAVNPPAPAHVVPVQPPTSSYTVPLVPAPGSAEGGLPPPPAMPQAATSPGTGY